MNCFARGPAFAAPALLLAASCAPSAPPRVPDPAAALSRTASILRAATAARPQVLRLLFYGQSISTPHWTDQAVRELRRAYPHVALDVRNMALGGFSSDRLEQTVARDAASFDPDLVVLHVYGDTGAYDRILRILRSRTAAEVVVSTDHVLSGAPGPFCATGLRLRWSPPPGCRGHLYFRPANWEDYVADTWLPRAAARYGLAVEPRRRRWQAYLSAHGLAPGALLADEVHPNAAGWRLMADLFTSWFEAVVARAPAPSRPAVTVLAPPVPSRTARYRVTGTRFDLVAAGPLAGRVAVRVDGRTPATLDGCWLDTRVSALPNLPDWPGLLRVRVDPGYHRADRWTVAIGASDAAQAAFRFSLGSAAAGYEGKGRADESFVSRSGRVRIEPGDWMLAEARRISGRPVPTGTRLSWERRFACTDETAVTLPNGAVRQRYVLAAGLPDGPHELEVRLLPGAPRVLELRAARPPLG